MLAAGVEVACGRRWAPRGRLVADRLGEIDVVDPLARSSQGVPLVTLGQVLFPEFGITTQALVIAV
ncbi:hypothetical protein A5733_08160 [Mycobacterium sp. NS-7484]|nr:hypothetical protein A5733_08160 [Mycobacterium sp. NS-7484]